MTDALSEQLRNHAEPRGRPHGPAISGGSPDEIQAHIAASVLLEAADTIESLQAEVERLREKADRYEHALKEIDAGVADGGWVCREIAEALRDG
jgi:hypothetical protein